MASNASSINRPRPSLTVETSTPPSLVPVTPSTASTRLTFTSSSSSPRTGPWTGTGNAGGSGGYTPHSARSAPTLYSDESLGRRKASQQLVPPSPSRSRLDPEYSARLQRSGGVHQQQQNGLVAPPGIVRGSPAGSDSFFRPSPIDTSSPGVFTGLGGPSAAGGTGGGGSSSLFETPSRPTTFFTSSPASSPARSFLGSPLSARSSFGSPAGTPRGGTPRGTPSRRSVSNITGGTTTDSTGYSDRFIPSRATSNLRFSVWDSDSADGRRGSRGDRGGGTASGGGTDANAANNAGGETNQGGGSEGGDAAATGGRSGDAAANQQQQGGAPSLLEMLLRSELLGENVDPRAPPSPSSPNRGSAAAAGGGARGARMRGQQRDPSTPLREGGNYLRYQSPRQVYRQDVFGAGGQPGGGGGPKTSVVNAFNLSPVGSASTQRLLSTPQKRKRRIAKVPFKVLDAPALQDDFYLNLVDWSSLNVLAVGLGSCVYLWSACTSKVTKLCDLAQSEDLVTSVSWTQRGTHLAVGTNRGEVQLWDTVKCKKIRVMDGHSARIGTLSWSGPTLASGSRDRLIYLRDMRSQQSYTAKLSAHKQEVCGLKWSFDEPAHLASGGNDNKLLVWDVKNTSQPVHRFAEHTAAVKAIAWSPHQHGLLASGGGTADRCIRFWNTLSGSGLSCVDTGSQVCNLAWSRNCNEIVSTHGYSLNQIVVWRYPSMTKVATLTGHTYRVLYLAMSPDGSTIVTGAGDETLRFWQVFPGPRSHDKSTGSGLLFPSSSGSVIR